MISKMSKVAMVVGTIMSAGASAVEVDATVGVTSDYVFRGISQKDEHAALQGSVDITSESGWYAGAWASEVAEGSEVDLYLGYKDKFMTSDTREWAYKVGVTSYQYSDSAYYDYEELNLSLSTDFVGATVGVDFNYAPDFTDGDYGVELDMYDAALKYSREAYGLEWHGLYGRTEIKSDTAGYDSDYDYWNIGVSKEFNKHLVVSVDYHDTDINDVDIADSRVVASAQYKF